MPTSPRFPQLWVTLARPEAAQRQLRERGPTGTEPSPLVPATGVCGTWLNCYGNQMFSQDRELDPCSKVTVTTVLWDQGL